MKLRNLFFALLALPLAFVACEPEPTPEPEPQPKPEEKTPVLTLTSNDVLDFKADGGVGFIKYTLENAVEGVELNATCEADWVTDLVAGDNVVFKVVANEGEARTTKVVVEYDTESFEVTVNQAAKGGNTTAPAINITSQNPMTFNHQEQMGSITYTIDNPIEGVNLSASANASWISQVTVDATNGEVVFLVAANSGDAREAAVTLTYGMLEQKVTIQQSEWVELAPEIVVVSDLTVAFEGGAQSIEYSIENPKEGVELEATCEAEWISNIVVAADAITFDVDANETEEVRNAVINLAYGDITAKVSVFQLSENADAGMNYLVYNIVSFEAINHTTTIWDIVMREKDDVLGEMSTRISFNLNSENVMYINDGTYTVADGGILVNTFTNNDYSTYRYNNSGGSADITDANIEVKNDLEAQTTVIKGTFTAGNNVVSFEYNGKVKGFIYNNISEEGITEWTTFATKYSFEDTYSLTAESVDGVTVSLYIHELGVTKATAGTCPSPGEYPVGDKQNPTTSNYVENLYLINGGINGKSLKSGKVVVEEGNRGLTVVSFDIIDENDTRWKGSYKGRL